MSLPGGAGYGHPLDRDRKAIIRDVVLGYVSIENSKRYYNLSLEEITLIEDAIRLGQQSNGL